MKIAIIGTGISGMGAAYLLHPHHDLTVYERNATIGGHSRTIDIKAGAKSIPVDTGFIVFNKRNYPLLTGLFKHLKVPVAKSDMSFGASINHGWLEYGSKGMFSQTRNVLRPQFWGMIFDILKFNRIAGQAEKIPVDLTLAQYLDQLKLGQWFKAYYLQAMGAAIWSCSVETMMKFPAKSFLRFFKNHGLLSVNDHPQWYTVRGGSREYITRLCAGFKDKIRLNCGVVKVVRMEGKVYVYDEQGGIGEFDQVIFACHANKALQLLEHPDPDERDILGAFQYQDNKVVVHRDLSFMPRTRGSWASWVYLSEKQVDENPVVSLSYWMNNLQPLDTDTAVIVTLNPGRQPEADSVLDEHVFAHPVFTVEALKAQMQLPGIQGRRGIWHVGAYQRYGFHEDGLLSAVKVVELMGVKPPWQ
jgi:predicted NAD/FAD-binding protein